VPGLLGTPLSLFLGAAARLLALLCRLVLVALVRAFLGSLAGLRLRLQARPFLGPAPFDIGLHAGFFLRLQTSFLLGTLDRFLLCLPAGLLGGAALLLLGAGASFPERHPTSLLLGSTAFLVHLVARFLLGPETGVVRRSPTGLLLRTRMLLRAPPSVFLCLP